MISKRRAPVWVCQTIGAALLATASSAHAQLLATPAPLLLNHPVVPDTGHLRSGGTTVALAGIQGWGGDAARLLQAFITENGDRVTCRPHDQGATGATTTDTYVCTMPTGLDVAETALANGAAEATPGAPAPYARQQAQAQAGQLGIWAGTPAAPLVLDHPVVQSTASVAAGGRSMTLDGISGVAAPSYTSRLQGYLDAHGSRLTCQRQPDDRHVCLLPDGTDLAAVALANGLARVTPDASAAYRADQAAAVAAQSGLWFDPSPSSGGSAAIPTVTAGPTCCSAIPANADAIAEVDGISTAVIGGEPVFFEYDPVFGFGFYDVRHRYHRAPERYAAILDRMHPNGSGLRGTVPAGASRLAVFHPPLPLGSPIQAAPFPVPQSRGLVIPPLFGSALVPLPPALHPSPVVGRPLAGWGGVPRSPFTQPTSRPVVVRPFLANPPFAGPTFTIPTVATPGGFRPSFMPRR